MVTKGQSLVGFWKRKDQVVYFYYKEADTFCQALVRGYLAITHSPRRPRPRFNSCNGRGRFRLPVVAAQRLIYNCHLMSQKEILRENFVALLTGEMSRMSFEEAVAEFPLDRINEKLPNADYTPWGLLEHLRLAQEDILDFIINLNYKYREWPAGYWPKKGSKATNADWEKSVRAFKKDAKELEKIASDSKTDLYKAIPWGEGETILREIVTVANHNAFHLGEFAIMRQTMGTWGKSHRG